MHASGIHPSPQRRTRTRGALIAAGERLFAQRSMDAVTIDDIVNDACVAKGSFYNHFDDKAALVSAIVEYVQADCEAKIGQANDGIDDPACRMVRALCVVMAYARAHPDRVQALTSLAARGTIASSPLNFGVAQDLRTGIVRGSFTSITVETGLLIVIGVVGTAVAHAIMEPSSTAADGVAVPVGAALLRALGYPDRQATALAHAAAADILIGGDTI